MAWSCKHCGATTFEQRVPVRGVYVETVYADGTTEGHHDDVIYGDNPRTVECCDCGKRQKRTEDHPND